MRAARAIATLGAALLAVPRALPCAAADAPGARAAASADAPWEVLIPSGQLGRFGLRVERAEFVGPPGQVAERIAQEWRRDPWPVLPGSDPARPGLSRLTPDGVETVSLEAGDNGRVRARRSRLEWHGGPSGMSSGIPEPAFLTALAVLGDPLPGFASVDRGTGNLTRVWLAAGGVDTVARRVEAVAARHGLASLARFEAPADAAEALRGGRVLAFRGRDGTLAVVTVARHGAGVAVVVHCQEHLP